MRFTTDLDSASSSPNPSFERRLYARNLNPKAHRLLSIHLQRQLLHPRMTSFRSNASKADVRSKLPKQNEKKDNDDWTKFELDSTYLWKTQISLDTKTSWSNLRAVDKDAALWILERECGGVSSSWGDLKRAVLEWRLYNLHRGAMKVESRRQTSAEIASVTHESVSNPKSSSTAMYDPVREASRNVQQ